MYRVACNFKLIPGMQEEYKRRHDNIKPEMFEVFEKAGIRNFTIWNVKEDIFAYYEVEDYEKSNKILVESGIIKAWDKYMDDLIQFEVNPETGRMYEMKQIFNYKAD